MALQISNNTFGTLGSGITNVAGTITLTAGHGARFPIAGGGNYFIATLIDASGNLEIVKVTNRAVDVLSVSRGIDGTAGRAFSAGDRIEVRPTAITLFSLQQEALAAATATGTDTYVATLTPAPFQLNTDQVYCARILNANTITTPTLNFNSLGAITIKRRDGGALVAGDLGGVHFFHYDGTNFIVLNPKWEAGTTFKGNNTITGSLSVGTTLGVTGVSTLAAVNASGDFNINTGKFTVAAATGNAVVAGTLGVTGASTLTGNVGINAAVIAGASLSIGDTSSASTTTPKVLSLGGTYGTTIANGVKVKVYDSGSTFGFGLIAGQFYMYGSDSTAFSFYGNGGEQVRITMTGTPTRYITLTGSNGGTPTIGTSAGTLYCSSGMYIAGSDAGQVQLQLGHSNQAAYWSLGRENVTSGDFIITKDAGTEKLRLTTNGLVVSGVGPHAIGGATLAYSGLRVTGAFSGNPGQETYSLLIDTNNASNAGVNSYGLVVAPTFNKAGSGTHNDFASATFFAATTNAGAAVLTNNTTVKITGAPSVGTNQRALWVAAGLSQFGGAVTMDSTLGVVGNADIGGHTIAPWASFEKVLQVAGGALGGAGVDQFVALQNVYFDGAFKYQRTGFFGSKITMANGAITLSATSTAGVAGNAATLTDYVTLTNSGLLTVAATLNYGGVTLSNSVTGTGSMVLHTNPTFNGLTGGGTLTNGFNISGSSISTGSYTVDNTRGPQAYITNGGAFTITAASADGNQMILVTNNASAGAITFSGFTVGSNTGDPLTTTNGSKFIISIVRINGTSTYSIKALQ